MADNPSSDGGGDYDFQSAFSQAAGAGGQPPEQTTPPAPSSPPPVAPVAQPPAASEPSRVPETPSEPTTTPPAVTPPSGTLTSEEGQSEIARAAAEAGFDTAGMSDVQIVQAITKQHQQLKPYAEWGQQLVPYADQIQEYFNQQQAQRGAGDAAVTQPGHEGARGGEQKEEWTPDGYFGEKWQEPKWDDQYDLAEKMGVVQRNSDTGLYEAVPGREAMAMPILNGMNHALMARQQQWQQITSSNPYRHFYDVLLEPMRRAWQQDMEQAVEQRLSQREVKSYVDDFERQNQWLYTKDQAGQLTMTPRGQAFYQAINTLREAGVNDPRTLLNLAVKMVPEGNGQAGTSSTVAAETSPASQVAAQQVAAAAAQTPQEASAQKQASFLDTAMEKARHSPSAGGYTQESPGTDPVNVSEIELQNMFVSDFRKTGAAG